MRHLGLVRAMCKVPRIGARMLVEMFIRTAKHLIRDAAREAMAISIGRGGSDATASAMAVQVRDSVVSDCYLRIPLSGKTSRSSVRFSAYNLRSGFCVRP